MGGPLDLQHSFLDTCSFTHATATPSSTNHTLDSNSLCAQRCSTPAAVPKIRLRARTNGDSWHSCHPSAAVAEAS
ncbi:hypothetical protein PsYK624_033330 [Phanerochaete sordida]|uniref:Uncharacterized protein n=1 Tax=Phanerochaete sordida TaxID=48140 RepID=A0A9P3L9K9_9APHY|nr:hypothetical protein PsYK624_033330 [Phanerochaete sordida]